MTGAGHLSGGCRHGLPECGESQGAEAGGDVGVGDQEVVGGEVEVVDGPPAGGAMGVGVATGGGATSSYNARFTTPRCPCREGRGVGYPLLSLTGFKGLL